MLRKLLLEHAFDTKYVQKHDFVGKCQGNHHLQHAFDTKYVQNRYFEGKCSENHYCKMHLTPNMYKNVTLKANAQKIITVKCI